ncbi:11159_t:CDS:2, partial [Gigaspora rosea]
TLGKIKEIKTTIWKSRNTKLHLQQKDKDRISFEKIVIPGNVITEQQEIKETTRGHFKKWTCHNTSDDSFWDSWEPYYKPINNILPDTYDSLTAPIIIEEINSVITAAPKNKAT